MSRSKHTDPRSIRSDRRVRSPHDARGLGDLSRRRQLGRFLKELGIATRDSETDQQHEPVQPRINVRRPRPGFLHPATRADVRWFFDFVGAEAVYGVKQIELAHSPGMSENSLPPFGRLVVPGRIMIYEQPLPPWQLPGVLSKKDSRRLQLAGASLEIGQAGVNTTVQWPDETLRDFMLFEVLAHEIGHHILQHNTGKRAVRIVRTRDHEAFAERFAERCRELWSESGEQE